MSEPEVKFKPDVLSNIVWDSDSDDDRPLTSLITNRVQLMRKIFKHVSSKRITQMAPKCLKEMPMSQMKSVLLDELMGISNKRLTSIINNTPDARRSSSSSDEDTAMVQKPDDVISLDDISDDSSVGIVDEVCMEIKLSERERLEMDFECAERKQKRKHKKSKEKHIKKNKIIVKTENLDNIIKKSDSPEILHNQEEDKDDKLTQDDPFVSALNLLELQARARAIRSQLLNEIIQDDNAPSTQLSGDSIVKIENKSGSSSPNSVVILSPERAVVEIQESSHSEGEENKRNDKLKENGQDKLNEEKIENDQTENEPEIVKENTELKVNNENKNLTTEDDDVLIMNEDDDILI